MSLFSWALDLVSDLDLHVLDKLRRSIEFPWISMVLMKWMEIKMMQTKGMKTNVANAAAVGEDARILIISTRLFENHCWCVLEDMLKKKPT